MYFKSRTEAGIALAEQIAPKYKNTKCSVIALNDGAVLVASQISLRLKCPLMLLVSEQIELPRELDPIGAVNQEGGYTVNSAMPSGLVSEFETEYRNLIDEEKMEKVHEVHEKIGKGHIIRKSLLRERTIILVSDGLNNGFPLDIAADFLKPLAFKKLVIATPLASVPAVDRMHVMADEIYCLSVIEDYLSTAHYYSVNDVPSHEVIIETIENILGNWPK